ncbi:alpha/beta hydrolase [Larsenimonas rhizosphaerae]|uniref:Alpha/beta hydrolase n=1 Tax=Larsenimonas rhizosphaerae TaxID=2944682 RepID=A0AA41ZHS5_9GAMM|nr:alpha/beta hydrolase [Larsenimonas rhizosphaerae]MCX2524399.1 alpha/beta hydrolase [Larsenimonas rhizosphaerae]
MTDPLPDFCTLSQTGPLAPVTSLDGVLGDYMAHYGLDHCLPHARTVHCGMIDATAWQLWAQVWCPPGPRGTVFIVHGYFDHLGLYAHILEALLKAHWQVVLWDLPGHGLSSGERASITAFDDYVECLHQVRSHVDRQRLAPTPWVGLGQSTGSAILATDALADTPTPWQSLCLLAPLVRPRGWQQTRWIHWALSPFVSSLKRTFRPNSTDAAFARFLRQDDPLQATALSVAWVSAMKVWIRDIRQRPSICLPALILQGEQDLTVDWRWNLPLLREKFPEARVVRHTRARHHLVNESPEIREPLFNALLDFIDAPLTPAERDITL